MARFVLAILVLALFGVASAQPPDLTGKWSGYWVSESKGHTGPLHARFRQIDSDTYRVAFRGRFRGIIPFWYTTKLEVTGTGDSVVQLGASQQLPIVGEYRTTATATATNFDATFTSRRESGRFVLNRR